MWKGRGGAPRQALTAEQSSNKGCSRCWHVHQPWRNAIRGGARVLMAAAIESPHMELGVVVTHR